MTLSRFLLALMAIVNSIYGQCQEKDISQIREEFLQLTYRNPNEALKSANQLLQKAHKIKNDLNIADAYLIKADLLLKQGKSELCLLACDSALYYYKKRNDFQNLAEVYSVLGANYQNQGDHSNGLKYHLLALDLAEKNGNNDLVNYTYRALSKISQVQNKKDEALSYLNKALALTPMLKKKESEINNYHALGEYYGVTGNKELSIKNYKTAELLAQKYKKPSLEAWALALNAINYADSDLNKSLSMMTRGQEIFDSLSIINTFSLTNLSNIGEVFSMFGKDEKLQSNFNLKGYSKDSLFQYAEKFMLRVYTISLANKDLFNEMNATGNLSNLYKYLKKYDKAYPLLLRYDTLKDSIFSQTNKNKIARLEAEKDILKLESDVRQKSLFNTILAISIGALILISFIGYRNIKQKQKIQKQQIKELEKEKQLAAVDALLKGQEEERSRLAKDLHDGLGGMLNGVKLQFNNVKEDLIMTQDNVLTFQKSIDQLDLIISELRRVSHNLMPDVLARFGLTQALCDFCISQSNETANVVFQEMGEVRRLENTQSLYIYRIVQELISNSLKHGKSTEVIAQLSFTKNHVLISVDDNGIGYNVADLINNKGMGMRSIKQRVDYFQGSMEIDSKPGKGTSVNIDFKI